MSHLTLPRLVAAAQAGDTRATEWLLRRFRPMMRSLARRYIPNGSGDQEDLMQECRLGLLRALRRYDPSRQTTFSTLAYWHMRGAVRHYLRDQGTTIRRPGWIQEADIRLRQMEERTPPEHLAAAAGLTEEQVQSVRESRRCISCASLDATQRGAKSITGLGRDESIGDCTPDPRDEPQEVLDRLAVREALVRLCPQCRAILVALIVREEPIEQYAARTGRTETAVSEHKRKALRRLGALMRGESPSPCRCSWYLREREE